VAHGGKNFKHKVQSNKDIMKEANEVGIHIGHR
jgi:hypothetical protein